MSIFLVYYHKNFEDHVLGAFPTQEDAKTEIYQFAQRYKAYVHLGSYDHYNIRSSETYGIDYDFSIKSIPYGTLRSLTNF